MKTVTGTFNDEESASKAVEMLTERGIPLDDIEVVVRTPRGTHEVPIESRTGAVKGAIIGGALGATLGGIASTLVATSVISAPGIGIADDGTVLTIVRGVLIGLGLGVGFGAIAGFSFWKERPLLAEDELASASASASVAVESDALHDDARSVLERAGAERITSGDSASRGVQSARRRA